MDFALKPNVPAARRAEMGTRSLAAISTANLALELAGLWAGIHKPEPFDYRVLHGSPRHLGSKQWLIGTALSAPGVMLVMQGALIAWLLVKPGTAPVRALTILGAMMSFGYPIERGFARSFREPSLQTPFAVAVEASSLAMVLIGSLGRRHPSVSGHHGR